MQATDTKAMADTSEACIQGVSQLLKQSSSSSDRKSSRNERTFMRRNSGSRRMVLLITLLITMAWLCEKFGEHLIIHKAKAKQASHLPDLNPTSFLPQRQHLPSHHCFIKSSHQWGDSSDPPGGMHTLSTTLHSTVPLTEWQTSEACTLGFLLTFLVHVWD